MIIYFFFSFKKFVNSYIFRIVLTVPIVYN